ncbi:MAG: hypothetical protein V3V22_07085 [Methylococcales bacterium]|jgi:hypothetical protein
MKKFLSILAIIMITFGGLSACTDDPDATTQRPQGGKYGAD